MRDLILDALSDQGVEYRLVDDSDELRLPCPECSLEKSYKFKLYFNTDKLRGQCWVCERVFNLRSLIQAFGLVGIKLKTTRRVSSTFTRLVSLREALVKRAVSVKLPERTALRKVKPAYRYVIGRGVSRPMIRLFRLYACLDVLDVFYNRIIFPVKNKEGLTTTYVGRSWDSGEKIRYLFLKGVKVFDYLYGEDKIEGHETVVLFEGVFSVLRTYELFQTVFNRTVAPLATFSHHLSAVQERTLRELGVRRVIIFFDGDSEEISSRLAARLSKWARVGRVTLPFLNQPDDYNPSELSRIVSKFVVRLSKTRLESLPEKFM